MKLVLLFFVTWLALPAWGDDSHFMRQMMQAIHAEDWASAKNYAQDARDPVIRDIYNWHYLRAGQGSFPEYEAFLEENSDWPGLAWLQERGEYSIPANLSADRVIQYIEANDAQTGYGLYRYLQALMQSGENDKASQALAKRALAISIKAEDMQNIGDLGVEGFVDARFDQVNYLIYEREKALAKTYLPMLPDAQLRIAQARLNVLGRVTEGTDIADGGVAYDKMRIAENDSQFTKVREIILAHSASRAAMGAPVYWADDRLDMARNALWHGDAKMAYAIASQHHLMKDEKYYPELEFYSGFLALEFLDDKSSARQHFENFKAAVNSPISLGRAGYWLGRAGDPTGYGFGAKWQTSFYGQLSAEKIGGLYDENLIKAQPPADYGTRAFMDSDNVRAALRFHNAGEELLARRFLAHQSETLSPEDAEAIGQLAIDLGLYHAAVHIGKNLARRSEVIAHSYYPLPPFLGQDIQVPDALAYAIMRQESEFYPRAESHVGARGLMQLMPGTAEEMAGELGLEYSHERLLDAPDYNVALGTNYIREMLIFFDGKLPVAVLSYNAGPGRGLSWQEHLGDFGGNTEDAVRWLEQIPFDETRNYVQRVLEAVFLYQAKIDGAYGAISPSQLLTQSYPEGVDYAAIKEERERAEEARKAAEEAENEGTSDGSAPKK